MKEKIYIVQLQESVVCTSEMRCTMVEALLRLRNNGSWHGFYDSGLERYKNWIAGYCYQWEQAGVEDEQSVTISDDDNLILVTRDKHLADRLWVGREENIGLSNSVVDWLQFDLMKVLSR